MNPPVSIVICTHNDGSLLRNNLPFILAQKYDAYEVVIVDHGSTDDTAEILQEIIEQHSNVRLEFVPYDRPGKRVALQKGIDAAKGSILLLTDADCKPHSLHWIALMVAPIQEGNDLVLGAAPFAATGEMLNAFSRWENFVTLQLFASEAFRQRPFMAIGRNMALRKELTFISGKSQDADLIGGDDDLFVNRLGKSHATCIVLNPDAHMVSPTKETIKAFLHQKRRHVSTSGRYQLPDQLFLFVFASSTWVQLLGLAIMFISGFWRIAICIYLIRLMGLVIRISPLAKSQIAFRFGWKLPFIDFAYLLYYPLLTLFMFQKPPLQWK